MANVDAVEYNGIEFRRYPDSDNPADRNYYRPHSGHIENGVEALHREVWKEHNGEIPDGHHIHHADGDPTNNDIGNLECLSPGEHLKRHPDIGGVQSDEHHAKMLEAAKGWHASDEGSKWHSQHWDESLGKVFEEAKTKDCDQCGAGFEYYTDARFCSNACKSKHRRESGVDDETRICESCRQPFETNKYSDTSTCSRRCAGALMSWTKRLQP